MNAEIQNMYDTLVPKDQLVIDAMLFALKNKDQDINRMTVQLQDVLNKLKGPGE